MKRYRTIFVVTLVVAIALSLLYLASGSMRHVEAQQQTGISGGAQISLQAAMNMISSYRAASAGALQGEYFSNGALQMLINQKGSVGVRMYYGRKTDGTQTLVLVGVDAGGHDLTAGPIMDNGFPCPPFCDGTSILGR